MKLRDMNIGSLITKLKETDQINNAQISSFYSGITQFVSTIAKKLFDISPVSYNVVRNSVIFDSLIMSQENVGVLQSKLKHRWTFSKLPKRRRIQFFLIRGGIEKRGGMV